MPNQSPISPWWLFGLEAVAASLLAILLYKWASAPFFYIVAAFAAVRFLGFAHAFFKQRAQFGIKDLLFFTLGVAVLCSIYACLGLVAVVVCLYFMGFIASACVAAENENREIAQRNFWRRKPTNIEDQNDRPAQSSCDSETIRQTNLE